MCLRRYKRPPLGRPSDFSWELFQASRFVSPPSLSLFSARGLRYTYTLPPLSSGPRLLSRLSLGPASDAVLRISLLPLVCVFRSLKRGCFSAQSHPRPPFPYRPQRLPRQSSAELCLFFERVESRKRLCKPRASICPVPQTIGSVFRFLVNLYLFCENHLRGN